MESIKLIGRSSRLSLLQIDIVKQKILSAFPNIQVEVIARSSKGDALQNIPLHTVEGSDFFTQDIFDALANNEIGFGQNDSHITIIPMEDATRCRQIANQLLEKHGVYLQPINYPTVPVGEECLRIIITARHLPKHINHLAYSLKKILHGDNQTDWKEFPAVALAD